MQTHVEISERFPILEIADDKIVSKMGDVTIAFEVLKKEIFTMSHPEYLETHQAFVRALKVLPVGTIFHMQDKYIRKEVQMEGSGGSFLQNASDQFFAGRPYQDHTCRIYLTRPPANRRPINSAHSTLLRRRLVQSDILDENKILEFEGYVGRFVHLLSEGSGLQLRRILSQELVSSRDKAGVIEQYWQLTGPGESSRTVCDIDFDDSIRVGDRHCVLFSLADAADLPNFCSPDTPYPRYSTDQTELSIGFAAGLGLPLQCNHILNQYILIQDTPNVLKKIEKKRGHLQALSARSRENTINQEAANAFLNEAISSQRITVRAHFNVMAWTNDRNELAALRNKIGSAIAGTDAVARQEFIGAPQLWWAGIPGNAAELPENECFDTFLEQACCFLGVETNYQSDEGPGIRMGDRLTGRPVNVDLFHQPIDDSVITNRGMFVCGGSGGGKSMLCNHIFRSLYDQRAHVVIVDIGGSYKGLCDIVGGHYFTYTETNPIRFNPFYLGKGESLDTEKKESLKALLITLWKEEYENFNRSEYVALSNALQGYYDKLEKDKTIGPGFNSFYEYLQEDYTRLLVEHSVKEKDFDIGNFLYVLRPYYRGGEFDYLLNASENFDLLESRFIVFELDNIKNHPILLPVVSLIIMELTVSKMRKIPRVLKAFAIEEAWKPMMQAGMAQFIKFAWKTFRKLYGVPIVVTQEVDDLISSPIIKEAIIGNSDIKILMDMRKFVNKFDALQSVLGMSDKGKNLLFSVNRANEPGRKYREFYLELGGQVMKVFRFEPSPEEYYAYTTERKEKERVMEYAKAFGGMQKGIAKLVVELPGH